MRAIVRMIRMVVGLTTGLKVSWKSNPAIWWKPLATSRALCLYTDPSAFCLILKTHLHPMGCLSGGSGTRDQVEFLCKAIYSSLIAFLHCSNWSASLTEVGASVATRTFGLKMPDFDLVCMPCELVVRIGW